VGITTATRPADASHKTFGKITFLTVSPTDFHPS
jgi:hypothetical protein